MDLALKKRKADENGAYGSLSTPSNLLPSDVRRIAEPLSQDQLLDILQDAAVRHPDVLDSLRALTGGDPSLRKLFIRGLGWDTTTEGLRSVFSAYGELQEAIAIVDKVTGKSKGYGFITFKHVDGAILALKEPSKLIDGRMTVTQLASSGGGGGVGAGPVAGGVDVTLRKIYVANVPFDMPAERLLLHFLAYGEIAEGPLGYDKQTGKSKGYALFVYKTAEGARAALVDPVKMLDGHQVVCKLAIEGKKGKGGAPGGGGGGAAGGMQGQAPVGVGGADVGALSGHFGGPGGLASYGSFSGMGIPGAAGLQGSAGVAQHQMSSGVGNPLPSVGGQVGAGGFGDIYGGSSQFGGPGLAGYRGLGTGPSPFQLQASSIGMPSGVYQEGGNYGLSAAAFQGQQSQLGGSSPGARIPGRGGMYQGMPPYY